MRIFIFANREIKDLLGKHTLSSNVKSDIWKLLSTDELHFGLYSNKESILQTSIEELDNEIETGIYLIEVEIDEEDIVERLPYGTYTSISRRPNTLRPSELNYLLESPRKLIDISDYIVVLFKNFNMDKVKSIYRYNTSAIPWVKCEIREGKLYHAVK